MVDLRSGTYGNYYGSRWGYSEPLTEAEMKVNAVYIYSALLAEGWTINAIAGMLGNMQAESSLNPGRWQSDDPFNLSLGFGLVQWTPSSKYTNWCADQGLTDPTQMDHNLARIKYEVENGLQWISTTTYGFSFKEFTKSTRSVSDLAKAFLLNYERPADQTQSVQIYRASLAEQWYTILTGQTPSQPGSSSGSGSGKKKKFKFVIFNQRRKQWIR